MIIHCFTPSASAHCLWVLIMGVSPIITQVTQTLNAERGVFVISLFTSMKNMTPWKTRVLRSFDRKNKFTAELCKQPSQKLGYGDLPEPEEVGSLSSKLSPGALIMWPAIPKNLLQNFSLPSCFWILQSPLWKWSVNRQVPRMCDLQIRNIGSLKRLC